MCPTTAAGRGGLVRIAGFIVLFAVAIPWYWEWAGFSPDGRTWGMPSWFVVAVLASLAISATTAWQLRQPWPSELQDAEEDQEP